MTKGGAGGVHPPTWRDGGVPTRVHRWRCGGGRLGRPGGLTQFARGEGVVVDERACLAPPTHASLYVARVLLLCSSGGDEAVAPLLPPPCRRRRRVEEKTFSLSADAQAARHARGGGLQARPLPAYRALHARPVRGVPAPPCPSLLTPANVSRRRG